MPKYIGREIYNNNEDQYSDFLEDRGVTSIEHYLTFVLGENYDTSFPTRQHVWKKGDKLFKLAYQYYGELKFWWIIGLWNNKPTDAHYTLGDVIEIPFPPEDIYASIVS